MYDYSNYAMVKDGVASRTPLPSELWGITPDGLFDLEWLPESYGVRGCQWWPIEDQSAPLATYQSYGDETLTLDPVRKVVLSFRPVRDWTAEEILAYKATITRHITKKALRSRFTRAEKIAFEMAQVDDPTSTHDARLLAAAVRVMEKDLAASDYVDLNSPELQNGLHELETIGVLGAGRADEMIWADIEPHEVP